LTKRWQLTKALMLAVIIGLAAQMCAISIPLKRNTMGIVYGANGALSGITVIAMGDNGSSYALTDSSGHYNMTTGLKTGTYNLTTFGYGYIADEEDFVGVTAGGTTVNVDFVLQASGGISGTVTDAVSLDPISGTEIFASLSNGTGTWGWFATTGSDGKYLIATNLPTGTYNVSTEFAPVGYIRQMTTANVVAGVETKNVNLQLARSGIISGRVTAPNGTGLFGVSVSAFSSDFTHFGTATTDSSGNYSIATGLATDNYTVSASGAGNFTTYGGLLPIPVSVTAGQETSGIDMELTPLTAPPTPSGTIAGRITDQNNNPIVSASVTASGSGGTGSNETDTNGYYTISSGLGTGNDYNVSVTASGYYDAYYATLVTITVDQTTPNIDIQMTAEPAENFGTITGIVTGDLNPITTVPEFQYPVMIMLSLTLATAVACKLVLKTRRCRISDNPP
jgi:hypothetical protein